MRADIKIERVGQQGQGVGYDSEGNVYFVPGGLPGDELEVEYPEGSRRYRDAVLTEIKVASRARVEPACPYFSECGGCDWLHWQYAAQLEAKESMLRHVFSRSNLEPEVIRPIRGADMNLGYRNRIQIHQSEGKTGFHRRKTHDIVDVESCQLADARLNRALQALRKTSSPSGLRRRIELSVGPDGHVASAEWSKEAKTCFTQVNPAQNSVLCDTVSSFVQEAYPHCVLELFCGDGNLTFAYASPSLRVLGIDNSALAIAKAVQTGQANVNFLCADVSRSLERRLPAEFRGRYDTLVLDPPRAGIECGLGHFMHEKLRAIVYVSCSPVSFSKDVQCLKKDFSFKAVQPIDMFPHSRHIEFVSYFTRSF